MSSSNESSTNAQQPVVIKQGGNGLGLVFAALIVAGAVIYSVNVWSTTKKETAPGQNLQQGIEKAGEKVKEGVGKLIESRQQ